MNVLIGLDLSDEDARGLRAAAPAADVALATDREGVLSEIRRADAYVPGPWGEEIVSAAERLRWVHFAWAGLDRQLFPALVRSDVVVTNSAGVFAVPMAEHVMALMLAFARGLHKCIGRPAEEVWHAEGARRRIAEGIRELKGATLGIVGYGGIGRAVAERARPFGMRVLAVRRNPRREKGAADVVWGTHRMDELLAGSDYVLVSCALTPDTRGLIGTRQLSLMRPHAVLINVARGAVVDEQALISALRSGRIGGAGLDVTGEEPLPPDSPLWQMDNVIITPHVAGASPNTWQRQLELLRENLRRFAAGEELLNVVDRAAGY